MVISSVKEIYFWLNGKMTVFCCGSVHSGGGEGDREIDRNNNNNTKSITHVVGLC